MAAMQIGSIRILSALLFVTALPILGQLPEGDHFEPCVEGLFHPPVVNQHVLQIQALLETPQDSIGGSSWCVARVFVVPAFDPESCLSIFTARDGRSLLVTSVAETNIWYANQTELTMPNGEVVGDWSPAPADIKVTTCSTLISCDTAEQVGGLWTALLRSARYPSEFVTRADGVYYFLSDGTGKCGRTWSPVEGSVPHDWQIIAEKLFALPTIVGSQEAARCEQEIQDKCKSLVNRLAAYGTMKPLAK